MARVSLSFFLVVALLMTLPLARALAEETATTTPKVVHVLGLEKVKRNAKGKLSVEPGKMQFAAGTARAEVLIPAILDIFTGDDSKRMIGGTLGTLTMFGPYGSGRFLSLFRSKVDTLTVEYRDDQGGLHGAVFMLPQGKAALVKKALISQGARASIPVEEEMKQEKSKEEKKP